jgi:hypothetical protein
MSLSNEALSVLCEGTNNTKSINREVINEIAPSGCAPSKPFMDGSCYSMEALIYMTNQWNKFTSHNPSKKPILLVVNEEIDKRKFRKYLLRQLTDRLKDVCDDQLCWLKQSFMKEDTGDKDIDIKKDIYENTFRPPAPRGKFKWLSTTNIVKVMKQYEKKDNTFKYLGAVPIDFDDIDVGVKDLDYKKLWDEGITKLGIIFNLDEHYKDGSHWVAMFADLKSGSIEFFDSYGYKPERRIMKLMKRIEEFCKTVGVTPKLVWNKNRHQFKDSECGVYSINFIVRRLDGESFEDITEKLTPDDDINQCRGVYFRTT